MERRSSKKRLIELGKSALIVLLIISTVFLGAETGLFSEPFSLRAIGSLFGQKPASSPSVGAFEYGEAAAPLAIAVTQEDGSRFAARYTPLVRDVYESFKLLLAEALGSAREPEKITESEWRGALGRSGVYFDYMFDEPLSLLAEWLGGEQIDSGVAGHTARRLLLAREDDGVGLYLARESDGEFFRATTALTYFSLGAHLPEYPAAGAAFEYETPGNRGLDPYFLFMNEMPSVPSAEGRAFGINIQSELLPVFGMNGYVAKHISQAGGEEYIENDLSLQILSSGAIRFRGGTPDAAAGERLSPAEAVNAAFSVASACLRPAEGRDFLQLRTLAYNEQTTEYTVTFAYILAGLPVVYPGSGPAAEIKIRGDAVVGAILYAREYTTFPESPELLLPEEAGFASLMGEGEPQLVYKDTGDSVTAAWDMTDG